MILSSSAIAERLRQSDSIDSSLQIVPTPHIHTDPDSASIDLRLGCWFTNFRVTQTSHHATYAATAGSKPPKAAINQLSADGINHHEKGEYIPFGSRFVLHPGQFTLAVTLEWLRLPDDLCAYVSTRSSWARYGLLLATATGVHPCFAGCLTLELSNIGVMPIELFPGTAICQLFFHRVEGKTHLKFRDSKFVGNRRPVLQPVSVDPVMGKLQMADPSHSP